MANIPNPPITNRTLTVIEGGKKMGVALDQFNNRVKRGYDDLSSRVSVLEGDTDGAGRTYSVFTSSANGLVPAPGSRALDLYHLAGDGSWQLTPSHSNVITLNNGFVPTNPHAGTFYYVTATPYRRATLQNGNLIPACTSRDNDTLRFGADNTNIGLEQTPFKTVDPNIAFIMADSEFSTASHRNYTVRGTAKAGYFNNQNYIDVTPDTVAADIGKFVWVGLGTYQGETIVAGDIIVYVDTTTGWRKIASTTAVT